jgi:hypothetical protein
MQTPPKWRRGISVQRMPERRSPRTWMQRCFYGRLSPMPEQNETRSNSLSRPSTCHSTSIPRKTARMANQVIRNVEVTRAQTLVAAADQALCFAKDERRNRLVIQGELSKGSCRISASRRTARKTRHAIPPRSLRRVERGVCSTEARIGPHIIATDFRNAEACGHREPRLTACD